MATTVGKIKSDRVSIKGVLSTEAPVPALSSGETHISFDEVIRLKRDMSALRVAGFFDAHATHFWYDYAQANAGSFTDFADITALQAMDFTQFDLLVIDCYVWAIYAPTRAVVELALAAGLSVAATGNDTHYNEYVVGGRQGSTQGSHTIVYEEWNVPSEVERHIESSTAGSTDLIGGINELKNGALPLYRRSDSGQITGFIYTHPDTGAKLYFDQEGVHNDFTRAMMPYVAGFSTSGITVSGGVNCAEDGTYFEDYTNNLESGNPDTLANATYPEKPFSIVAHCTNDGNATGQNNVPPPPFEGGQVYKVIGGSPDNYSRISLKPRVPDVDWTGYDKLYMVSVWAYFPSAMNSVSPTMSTAAAQNNTGTDWHTGDKSPDPTNGYWSRDIEIESKPFDHSIRDKWQRSWILIKPETAHINASGNNDLTQVVVRFGLAMRDDATNDGVNYCYVSSLQVEEGVDLTAYVNGTRLSDPSVEIPVISSNDFSVATTIVPSVEYYHLYPSSYGRELYTVIDEATGAELRYRDYHGAPATTNTYSTPFINCEPDSHFDGVQHHYHHSYPYYEGKPLTIIHSKSGDDNIVRVYNENGQVIRSQTFTYADGTTMADFIPTKLRIGSGGGRDVWSSKFLKMSHFPYALTEQQADEWAKTTFRVDTDGDMYTDDIEESIFVPDDCAHFPLSVDAMDKSKTISPEIELYVDYEEGGAWVASPWNNQYDTYSLGPILTLVEEDEWLKITRATDDASFGFRGRADETTLVDAAYYTASMTVHNPLNTAATIYMDWCDDNPNSKTWTVPPNETMKIWVTGVRSTYDATYNFFDLYPTQLGQQIWVKDIRIDRGEYRRPYSKVLGEESHLAYNLHRDYGVDWSADWSIVFFVKPVGTSTDHVKTGYNLSALGRHDANLTWGYTYFGKAPNVNEIYDATNNAFDPADYFDKWHMVSAVNTGGVVSYREYGINSSEYSEMVRSSTGYTADYFVTPENFDFQLGSWTNGTSASNSIFRDLIVAKRALTTAELDSIRKNWVNVNIDRARFSELYEGNL